LLLGIAFGQPAKDAENTTAVLGCVERAGEKYVIVDHRGSTYVLDGVGDRLSGEVGHTLEVKGKLTDSTRSRNNHAAKLTPTLSVASVIDDVHRVGDYCASR